MFALLAVLATAEAADPNKAHDHQGVIGAWSGAPTLPDLTEAELQTLASGKPVQKQVRTASGGRGVAIQDINASPDVVWGRILDFARYPRMVDGVYECEEYARSGDHVYVRFVIGAMLLKVEYYVDHVVNRDQGYLTWSLDYSRNSDLSDSVGYWYVQQLDDRPGWTRVFYSVDVRLKGWVPKAIENMLAKQGLPKATGWVKRESERNSQ